MARLDRHRDAAWLHQTFEVVGDLGSHPLLELRTPGIVVDEPGGSADPDQLPARKVGDMRVAEERDEMMHAQRVEFDVPNHDEVAEPTNVREHDQIGLVPEIESREDFPVELSQPCRRPRQLGLGSRIEAECLDQVGDCTLDAGTVPAWAIRGHAHLRDLMRIGAGGEPAPAQDGAEDGIRTRDNHLGKVGLYRAELLPRERTPGTIASAAATRQWRAEAIVRYNFAPCRSSSRSTAARPWPAPTASTR